MFLRDYEVAVQTGREAERLSSKVRQARIGFEIASTWQQDLSKVHEILMGLKSVEVGVDLIMAAEQVPLISTFGEFMNRMDNRRTSKSKTKEPN